MSTNRGIYAGGRQRRQHSEPFKASVVAACRRPGVSLAAVALANGLNANLLRRWVSERAGVRPEQLAALATRAPSSNPEFVPLQLLSPASTPAAEARIQIELRRGVTTVNVSWPLEGAEACAAWLRSWLQ